MYVLATEVVVRQFCLYMPHEVSVLRVLVLAATQETVAERK